LELFANFKFIVYFVQFLNIIVTNWYVAYQLLFNDEKSNVTTRIEILDREIKYTSR